MHPETWRLFQRGLLTTVLAIGALPAPTRLGAAAPKDPTNVKIDLMAEALRARDRGDLLAAQMAVTELSKISPTDTAVQRLRKEIETQLAAVKAATQKIAAEGKPAREQPIVDPKAGIAVEIPNASSAAPARPKFVPKRVSFFSARAFIGAEEKKVAIKFAVEGPNARLVLIRGIGPALKTPQFKKGFLAEPFIELLGAGDILLKSNSDWQKSGDPSFITAMVTESGGTPFDPNSRDAAIVATLEPGSYSVRFSGLREKTGIGVVEIYQFNP